MLGGNRKTYLHENGCPFPHATGSFLKSYRNKYLRIHTSQETPDVLSVVMRTRKASPFVRKPSKAFRGHKSFFSGKPEIDFFRPLEDILRDREAVGSFPGPQNTPQRPDTTRIWLWSCSVEWTRSFQGSEAGCGQDRGLPQTTSGLE